MKKVDYSEIIAACDLKLIELMKICEYSRSRSFLDLGPMSFTDENLTCFSQKPLAHFPFLDGDVPRHPSYGV